MLWRSGNVTAKGGVLGARQFGGTARGVRRSQTVLRSDDHGVSPPSRSGYAHCTDFQYLWTADATERRAGAAQLCVSSAQRASTDDLRRWKADAKFLLRGRFD